MPHVDLGTSNALVQIVTAAIWPVTLLILVFTFKRQLLNTVSNLNERIRDPRTALEFTTEGFRLKTIEREISNRGETLDATIREISAHAEAKGDSDHFDPFSQLKDKAREYDLVLNNPEIDDRLAALERLASVLGAFVIAHKIDRDHLANVSVQESSDGLLLALLSAVATLPVSGDAARILRVGKRVRRPALVYRVTSALRRLAERRLISQDERSKVLSLVGRYEQNLKRPDGYTHANIDAIRDLLLA